MVVWNQHLALDGAQCWDTFRASRFFPYYPTCQWTRAPWCLERVLRVLRVMREASSPGVRGIPISLWRSLPEEVLARVADLLNLIEQEGSWPEELSYDSKDLWGLPASRPTTFHSA